MLKSIPLGLAQQICKFVKNTNIRTAKLSELKADFRKQKYPSKVLHTETNVPETPILSFISTFNLNNSSMFPTIKNTIKNFLKSKTMKEVFKDSKLI